LLAHLTNLGLNTCSFRWRSDISFMVLFRGSWSRSSGVQWTMGSSRAVARRPGLSMSEIRMLVKEPTLSLKFREGESPTRTTMPCLSISSPTLWKGERSHLYILIQPTVLFLASCQEKLSTYLDCRTEELLDITAQRCGTRLRAPTKSCFGRARYSLRAYCPRLRASGAAKTQVAMPPKTAAAKSMTYSAHLLLVQPKRASELGFQKIPQNFAVKCDRICRIWTIAHATGQIRDRFRAVWTSK